MDLSSNMISIGIDRRRAGNFHKVDFEICNVLTKDFVPQSYDVIYSRDAIMHIVDKQRLFQTLFVSTLNAQFLQRLAALCGLNMIFSFRNA